LNIQLHHNRTMLRQRSDQIEHLHASTHARNCILDSSPYIKNREYSLWQVDISA